MKKVKEIQIYIKDEETFLNTYYTENYKKLLGISTQILIKFKKNLQKKWSMYTQHGPVPAR